MPKPRIVGMMTVYNEADILEQTIRYTNQQGIPLVIVDDGSTDGSQEIERQFLGNGVLEANTFHEAYSGEVFQKGLQAYDFALKYSPDWIVSLGADEFLESPFPNTTLNEAIGIVDEDGYNLIQFNCFDFCLTENDFSSHILDVRERMKYYTFIGDFFFRAWKPLLGVNVSANAGHKPVFPKGVEEHIPPFKFAIRHYRFRSLQHGIRKVFTERLPRYPLKERAMGWHGHYDNFKPDPSYFIIPSSKLNRYNEDGNWNLERKFDSSFGAWKCP